MSIDDDKPTVPVTCLIGCVMFLGLILLALAVVGAIELVRAWL